LVGKYFWKNKDLKMENEGITKCPRCDGRGYDKYYNDGKYFNSLGQIGYCRCEEGMKWACFIKDRPEHIIEYCDRITGPMHISCFVCHGKGQITWVDKVFEKYNPRMELYDHATD